MLHTRLESRMFQIVSNDALARTHFRPRQIAGSMRAISLCEFQINCDGEYLEAKLVDDERATVS